MKHLTTLASHSLHALCVAGPDICMPLDELEHQQRDGLSPVGKTGMWMRILLRRKYRSLRNRSSFVSVLRLPSA